MTHSQIQEQLSLYRYLSPSEREEVDRHVQACAECAARLRSFAAMDRDLATLSLARPAPRVRERFYSAVQGKQRRQVTHWSHLSAYASGAAGIAVLLLVVLALWAVFQTLNQSSVPSAQPPARPTPITALNPVLKWQRGEGAQCKSLAIDANGDAAFGPCANPDKRGRILADSSRPDDLAHFLKSFKSFKGDTVVGSLELKGTGSRKATEAEQRSVAEWASLVYQELDMGRGGASWGLGIAVLQEGTSPCTWIEIEYYGKVFAADCRSSGVVYPAAWLDADELGRLQLWLDTLAADEVNSTQKEGETPTRVVFSGRGSTPPTEADRQEIIDYANSVYATVAQTEMPALADARSLLPLTLGEMWVYQSTRYEGMNAGELMTATQTITETVVEVRQEPQHAVKIRRDTSDDTPVSVAKGLEGLVRKNGESKAYWLLVEGNRVYKKAGEPDLSKLSDNDSLELVLPLNPDDQWVWQPAALPAQRATQGVKRQVMQIGAVDVPAGHFANCAQIKDGWNTDTAWGWFCSGVGWVEIKSDHNGTPLGHHDLLVSHTIPSHDPAGDAARAVLDQFMQMRIRRDDQAFLNLLSPTLRSSIDKAQGPTTQVSNPCWYRYEILEFVGAGTSTYEARVRVYQHFWPGDNAGGLPRSWEQRVVLKNTAEGWRIDGLGNAENEREEPNEPHGPTLSACNAAAQPAPTATPATLTLPSPNPVPPDAKTLTYHDSTFGFSFDYPANWQVETPTGVNVDGGTSVTVRNFDNVIQKGDMKTDQIAIIVMFEPRPKDYADLEQWYEKQKAIASVDLAISLSPSAPLTVANQPAVRWTSKSTQAPQGIVQTLFFKDPWLYTINAYPSTSKYIEVLDRLIASLRLGN